MTIRLDFEKVMSIVQFMLVVILLILLLWSQPWNKQSDALVRKITVNGEETIRAEPDEFVFYPYLEAKGADADALKETLNAKANDVVIKLKELGVAEEKIKLDSSSYDGWYLDEKNEGILTVQFTVTLNDKDTVQAVQDYFSTLDLKGQLTPQSAFSRSKQKELEAQGTEKAIADARAKAQVQVEQLGAKLGDVIAVEQSYQGGYAVFSESSAQLDSKAAASAGSLPVLPGENEYTQSVTVTYEIR